MPCLAAYTFGSSSDVRVTTSANNQSRSESVVSINPKNSQNMICASKKFTDPHNYRSTISTSFTFDGGQSWTESQLQLQSGWEGMTDPDLTFDHFGNAYLIVQPDTYFPDSPPSCCGCACGRYICLKVG